MGLRHKHIVFANSLPVKGFLIPLSIDIHRLPVLASECIMEGFQNKDALFRVDR